MGKGQRSRAARAEEMARKKIEMKKKAKRAKITKLLTSICAIVVVVALVGGITYGVVHTKLKDNGVLLHRDIALSSENYEINNAMMMYYFQNNYAAFVSQYQNYLSYYGLDTSKSLKEQNYPGTSADGGTQSWYDYFMTSTRDQVKQTLVLAEAAKASGLTLTEDEEKNITEAIQKLTLENFAPGLTENDVRLCMQIATLAENYQEQVQDAIECTDADIDQYYTEHKNDYDICDYRMYTFNYKSEDSEEEEAATLTKEQAKKYADELAACNTEDAFVAWLSNYFTNTLKTEADKLQTELDGTKTEGFAYSENYDGTEFLFNSETKALQTKVLENEDDNSYKVYMLITPRHKDTTLLKNVRHILFRADSEDEKAMAEAKTKADEALAKWKNEGATEDKFAELAKELSSDSSASDGGLIEDISKGQMVEAFENWCFDATRKTGDTGIVQTEYGYHVMYFVKNGVAKWKSDVEATYRSEKYSEKYKEFESAHAVTVNDKKIANIAEYFN